ncbi:MAG: phage tail tape measure protein, partial [Bacteroidetes bacterium]|nr:phage tail tape measure protein [Bacteroidota bacterium]
MARNEKAKATIYLDGKQAEAALDSLKTKAKDLRRELKKAQEAGDIVKTKKLQSELKGVEAATRSLRKETYDYEKVLRDINGASMSDLKKALRTVEVQLNKMKRTDPGYAQKAAQAKLLRTEITKVNTSMRAQPSFIGKAAAGFNKYFSIVTAGIAAFTGILFSAKEFIKGMVGLDDALADVMKTTGMARDEVREMYQDFKTFNTRTPRRELLMLAEEAGRLGKKSRKDVMDFVEVANQIKVALGDDLGGEAGVAIREVGKLTEIYKVGEEYGTDFKESMLKVGSAINEVSANSNAQAPYLIDYLKRMGGIAGQTKVNTAKIIGYGASLDQLGQKQEMAATVHGKVMVDMFKDQAKYATIAQMSTKDFTTLLETDANEAFLKLLEGLNGNNEGFSVMAKKLDDLGIDGARAVQVLSVLSANTKMVREQQALANKAMIEGTSLTNEYNIKNNNLAGSWEKLGQYMHSKFINSNFLGWLEKVVGKTAEWTEVKLFETLQKEQSELNLLVASVTNVNNTQETRNTLIDELQRKYPDFLSNLDAEKLTNEELRDRLKEVNDEYEDKILLSIKEDALKANYKERMDLKLQELDAIKKIAKYEEIAQKARAKVAGETDPNKLRTLLTDKEIA